MFCLLFACAGEAYVFLFSRIVRVIVAVTVVVTVVVRVLFFVHI